MAAKNRRWKDKNDDWLVKHKPAIVKTKNNRVAGWEKTPEFAHVPDVGRRKPRKKPTVSPKQTNLNGTAVFG